MKFSEYITKKRNERELSIRQLALYSGVSPGYISQIENENRGIPSPDILKKLSNGLKVPYDEMLDIAGYRDEPDSQDEREVIIKKIATEFPDIDLMFKDMESMTAEDLQEVYEFVKFKKSQKENN